MQAASALKHIFEIYLYLNAQTHEYHLLQLYYCGGFMRRVLFYYYLVLLCKVLCYSCSCCYIKMSHIVLYVALYSEIFLLTLFTLSNNHVYSIPWKSQCLIAGEPLLDPTRGYSDSPQAPWR